MSIAGKRYMLLAMRRVQCRRMRIAEDAHPDGQQKEVKGYQNGTFHDEITQILPVIFAEEQSLPKRNHEPADGAAPCKKLVHGMGGHHGRNNASNSESDG